MGLIAHKYGIHRCRRCGVQRSEGPSCGACGAPNSERDWIDVVPLTDHRGAVRLLREVYENPDVVNTNNWQERVDELVAPEMSAEEFLGPER